MEKQRVMPFLSFTGRTEEAIKFYSLSLPDVKITKLVRYGTGHPYAGEGEENLVLNILEKVDGRNFAAVPLIAGGIRRKAA